MKTQGQIKDYAQIVHQYYLEGTFDKEDVMDWLGEIDSELHELSKHKISFVYFDDWYPTKMTVYKSGRIKVETDLDELP